jgi:hypothetical protein
MADEARAEPAADDPAREDGERITARLVLRSGLPDNHPRMIAIGAEP